MLKQADSHSHFNYLMNKSQYFNFPYLYRIEQLIICSMSYEFLTNFMTNFSNEILYFRTTFIYIHFIKILKMNYNDCSDDDDSSGDWDVPNPSMPANINLSPPPHIFGNTNLNPYTALQPSTYYNGYSSQPYQYSSYSNQYSSTNGAYSNPCANQNKPNLCQPLEQTAPPNIPSNNNIKTPSLSVSNTQPVFKWSVQPKLGQISQNKQIKCLNKQTIATNSLHPNPLQQKPVNSLNYYGFNTTVSSSGNSTLYSNPQHYLNVQNQLAIKAGLINNKQSLNNSTNAQSSGSTFADAINKNNVQPVKKKGLFDDDSEDQDGQFKLTLKKKTSLLTKTLPSQNTITNTLFTPNCQINEAKKQQKKNIFSANTQIHDAKSYSSDQSNQSFVISPLCQKAQVKQVSSKTEQIIKNDQIKIQHTNVVVKLKSEENLNVQKISQQDNKKKTQISKQNHVSDEDSLKTKVLKLQKRNQDLEQQNKSMLEIIKNLSQALKNSAQNMALIVKKGEKDPGYMQAQRQNHRDYSYKTRQQQKNQSKVIQCSKKDKISIKKQMHMLTSDGYRVSLLIGYSKLTTETSFNKTKQQPKEYETNQNYKRLVNFAFITKVEHKDCLISKQIALKHQKVSSFIYQQQKLCQKDEEFIGNLKKQGYKQIKIPSNQVQINQIQFPTQKQKLNLSQQIKQRQKDQQLLEKLMKKINNILTWLLIDSKSQQQGFFRQASFDQYICFQMDQSLFQLNKELDLGEPGKERQKQHVQ